MVVKKSNKELEEKVDWLRRQIGREEVYGVEVSSDKKFVGVQFMKGKTLFVLSFPIGKWDYSDYEQVPYEDLKEFGGDI